jgi:hypothetical protein
VIEDNDYGTILPFTPGDGNVPAFDEGGDGGRAVGRGGKDSAEHCLGRLEIQAWKTALRLWCEMQHK